MTDQLNWTFRPQKPFLSRNEHVIQERWYVTGTDSVVVVGWLSAVMYRSLELYFVIINACGNESLQHC